MRYSMRLVRPRRLFPQIGLAGLPENKAHYFLLLPLGLFSLLLPFENLLVFGSGEQGPTLARYIGIVIIFLFSINFLVSKLSFRPSQAQLWLVLFFGFACLSVWWSVSPESTIKRIPTILNLLLFYLVVGTFRPNTKDLDTLRLMIVAGGVGAALYTIYAYRFLDLSFASTMRATFIYGETEINPNLFAFSLLLPFSLSLLKLAQVRGWRRLGYWLAFLGMGYAILISGSRGGSLGMLAVVALSGWRKGSKRTRLAYVALIIMALLAMYSSDVFFERITLQKESFEYSRGEIWKMGLSALPNYWFLGSGLDSYPTIYSAMSNINVHGFGAHNTYIGALVELGVLGLFILVMALVWHFKALRNCDARYPDIAFALKAALLGMLVQGASMDILYLKNFWIVLTLITMLSAGAAEASKGVDHALAWSASIRGRTAGGGRGR